MLADVTDARKALAALLGQQKLEFFPTERNGKPTLGFRGKVAATSFFLAANHIGLASPRGCETIPVLRTISAVELRTGAAIARPAGS